MKDEGEEPVTEGPRSFSVVLQGLAGGDAHAELSEELHRLLGEMSDKAAAGDEAKGELNLKLKFSIEKGGTVDVLYDIAVKRPKPTRAKGVYWLTKGGNLASENPRQVKLPLRTVAEPAVRQFEQEAPRAPRKV